MTKAHIIDEIRRIAAANGNVPPGRLKLEAETGIKETDWCGVFWARWSDAVREAGYEPNRFNEAYEDNHLLENFAQFTRELGRIPARGDLRLKARNDPEFPSDKTFDRFGGKASLVQRVAEYCRSRNEYPDVIQICESYAGTNDRPESPQDESETDTETETIGYVYLMRSGRFWKIGKSNAAGRREYELAIQLPEKLVLVHSIRTDDPSGIEAYWHKRFEAKRRNGEWFELNAADVKAFKRRKYM